MINNSDESKKAYAQALAFLNRKPRSAAEVIQKLKDKGHEDALIPPIIQRLKEQRFLDDVHFAMIWSEYRILSQNKGKRWVRQELKQKGIADEVIDGALSGIHAEDEYQRALELAKKKWGRMEGNTLDRKRKITALLLRRGYSSSFLKQIFNEVEH